MYIVSKDNKDLVEFNKDEVTIILEKAGYKQTTIDKNTLGNIIEVNL